MKIMIRKKDGAVLVYAPKKDVEEPVVDQEKPDLWGGWIKLRNGWTLELPERDDNPALPLTVEARKLADEA